MINRYRKIIVVLLLANILFANIGLSVNWMYCYCKGSMQVSLFAIDDGCKDLEDRSSACCINNSAEKSLITEKSCCSKFEKYRTAKKPCTKKGTKYFKADLKFFPAEDSFKKHSAFEFAQSSTIPVFADWSTSLIRFSPSIIYGKSPPPRQGGRSLLISIQNFRC
ncbi:MAG: HYC_CC_PP family protein [Saprospiraceae bacterium]